MQACNNTQMHTVVVLNLLYLHTGNSRCRLAGINSSFPGREMNHISNKKGRYFIHMKVTMHTVCMHILYTYLECERLHASTDIL